MTDDPRGKIPLGFSYQQGSERPVIAAVDNVARTLDELRESTKNMAATSEESLRALAEALASPIQSAKELEAQTKKLAEAEKLRQQAIKQTAEYQKDAAAAERTLRKQALADIQAEVDLEEQFRKSMEEEAKGPGAAAFSGRGFGALGRLAGRVGAPRGLSEGLFITGEALAGGRGVSRAVSSIPLIGGAAAEGGQLGAAGFAAFDKLLGGTGALTPQITALATSFGAVYAVVVPLVLAVGAIAVAVKTFSDTLAPASSALKTASDQLTDYYKVIEKGTTASISEQLKAAELQKELADKELAQRQQATANAFTAAQQGFGGDAVARLEFALAGTQEGFKANADRITELQKASDAAGAEMNALNLALDSDAVKANDAAEAQKKLAAQQEASAIASAESAAQLQTQIAELQRTGTSQQVNSMIQKNEDLIASYTTEIETLKGLDDTTGKAGERITELQQNIDQLTTANRELNAQVAAQVALREAAAQTEKDNLETIDYQSTEQKKLNDLKKTGTEDQVKATIEANTIQIATNKEKMQLILADAAKQGQATDEQNKLFNELSKQTDRLTLETNTLTDSILPAIQARDAEAEAAKRLTEGILGAVKAIDEFNAARDKEMQQEADLTSAYNEKTAQVVADRQARDLQQQQDFETQRSQKSADFYLKQAQQDQDFYGSQGDKLKKIYDTADEGFKNTQAQIYKESVRYSQKLADDAAKLAEQINRIINDSREKELDAASRLDARAIAQEERNKQKQIADAMAKYNQDRQTQARDYSVKIADMQAQAQKEHDQKVAQGLADLADADKQYQIKRQREEQQFLTEQRRSDEAFRTKQQRQQEADQREDETRRQSYERQLSNLQNNLLLRQEQLQANSYVRQLQAAQTFWDQMVQQAGLAARNAAAMIPSATGPQYGSTSYGGYRAPDQYVAPAPLSYGAGFTPSGVLSAANSLLSSFQASPVGGLLGSLGHALGFAEGGVAPANRLVSLAERGPELVGVPSLAMFRRPTSVLSTGDTARLLGRGGGKSMTVNGPLIGQINGTGLSESQLTSAVETALINVMESEANS